MSPFEALYGRKCRTPLMWSEVGERSYFGPECIQEAEEQVAKIRENLNAAQSRKKKAMLTPEDVIWTSKKETMCI